MERVEPEPVESGGARTNCIFREQQEQIALDEQIARHEQEREQARAARRTMRREDWPITRQNKSDFMKKENQPSTPTNVTSGNFAENLSPELHQKREGKTCGQESKVCILELASQCRQICVVWTFGDWFLHVLY